MTINKSAINQFSKKTSIRIALAISAMLVVLLIIMNAVVIIQSRDIFVSVVGTIDIDRNGEILFSPSNYSSNGQINILTFDSQGRIRPKPLQEVYIENLQQVFFKAAIIAIIAAIAIGILTSQIFSRPLAHISQGINKLRKNDYKVVLEKTGTPEFDVVIEEFNRLTGELQRVENLRKDLISDTSHELKTPLTILMGQLEGMKDGVFEASPERIEKLLDNVYRLNDLVETLQEFTRIRNKNYTLKKTNIALQQFINKVVDSLSQDVQQSNLQIQIDINDSLILQADEYMLQRVFENLIMNTIKYANATLLTFTANENSITITDNGKGIDSKHLPYIFERFYRVEKSRNRQTGGLGLGLAIVKEIIESHGWTIEVLSNTKTFQGVQFTITFTK